MFLNSCLIRGLGDVTLRMAMILVLPEHSPNRVFLAQPSLIGGPPVW